MVFVNISVQGEGGIRWLKVPDGWIAEEAMVEGSRRLQAVPLCKEKREKPEVASNDVKPAEKMQEVQSSSGNFYSRRHSISRHDSSLGEMYVHDNAPTSKEDMQQYSPHTKSMHNDARLDTAENRLEQIFALQNDIRKLTQQMTDVSEAVLRCQLKLSQLAKGTIFFLASMILRQCVYISFMCNAIEEVESMDKETDSLISQLKTEPERKPGAAAVKADQLLK